MKKIKFLLPLTILCAMVLTGCNSQSSQSTIPDGSSGQDSSESLPPSSSESQPGDDSSSDSESEPPVVVKYTVTFNSKGGSAVRKQEVEEGKTATKPTDPTKSGYDFVNWYTEEAYNNVFDFATPITQNITLYAKWKLSVSPVLLTTLTPDSVDSGDTEFSVWTTSDFIGHTVNGWQTGCTINMSWRTVLAVDAQGRVCFAVWCPANGYGAPKEYSYVSHEYYSKDGVGYSNNPAFKLGSNFAANGADWELVVPEGGFIITGHTNGATIIDSLVSGGKFGLYGGDDETLARSFNKTHGEFSTRSFFFRNGKVEAYDLATHLTYTGSKSGAFEGDADTGVYSQTLMMYEDDTIAMNFFDGVVDFDITESVSTITGDYTSTRGGDGSAKMYVASDETKNTLIAGARGKYTFDYSYLTNTLNITYVETNSFYLYLNNVLCDEVERMGVTYNEPFTLPTPKIPAGYTFSRWVNGQGQTVESGTYSIKDDMYLYAAFKDGENKEVAYTGKQPALSTSADSMFTVVDSTSGFIAHSHDGWNVGCTWNMSWRTFAVIDNQGRVCYAVWCAANGYGGPKAYSYHCDPYYQSFGVGYEGNPIFTIDPEFGDWPNKTEDGRNAWDLFTITIPEGGHLISSYEGGANTLVSMLSGGQLTEAGASLNQGHNWDTRFDFANDGTVYSRLNLA